ncbi:MAG: hypothetical protein AB1589_19415 [Cyanobacteriota bacterium]
MGIGDRIGDAFRDLEGGRRHRDELYEREDERDYLNEDYEDDQEDEEDEERPYQHRDQVRESGDYDEAEERWHLHRLDVEQEDEEDEERRYRYRDEVRESGDYDEAEERWNL